jgi:hypothetical protein
MHMSAFILTGCLLAGCFSLSCNKQVDELSTVEGYYRTRVRSVGNRPNGPLMQYFDTTYYTTYRAQLVSDSMMRFYDTAATWKSFYYRYTGVRYEYNQLPPGWGDSKYVVHFFPDLDSVIAWRQWGTPNARTDDTVFGTRTR